jgi:hypothetical protein
VDVVHGRWLAGIPSNGGLDQRPDVEGEALVERGRKMAALKRPLCEELALVEVHGASAHLPTIDGEADAPAVLHVDFLLQLLVVADADVGVAGGYQDTVSAFRPSRSRCRDNGLRAQRRHQAEVEDADGFHGLQLP